MKQDYSNPLWVALAMLTALSMSDSAQAQRGGGRGGSSGWGFVAGKYDANKDGQVTLQEYTRGATAFKALDTNADGVINGTDWQSRSRRSTGQAPTEGDVAPDFSLTEIRDAESTITLSEFTGKKSVALIFGSCT